MPLKMYTPFRLKPRIFPAVVSATVAASEAMTRLRPPAVANLVFEGGSGMGFDTAGDRKMTEPAKPAPKVAMPPMKERRSCLTSQILSGGAILDASQQSESLASARFLLLK